MIPEQSSQRQPNQLHLIWENIPSPIKLPQETRKTLIEITSELIAVQLKKNPDRRVQEVTQLVFSKFREYGTMRQVLNWFLQEDIKVPVTSNGKGPRCIQWKLPISSSILRILDNPIYAGAYAHGRTETRVTIENGRKRLKRGIRKEQKDWDVLIKDHHEGYISWQEYQKNVAVLCENANKERPVVKGAAGKGEALLAGLLRCGHCGGKLAVRYAGGNGDIGVISVVKNELESKKNSVYRSVASELIERLHVVFLGSYQVLA